VDASVVDISVIEISITIAQWQFIRQSPSSYVIDSGWRFGGEDRLWMSGPENLCPQMNRAAPPANAAATRPDRYGAPRYLPRGKRLNA
jgi:hypothetical protein